MGREERKKERGVGREANINKDRNEALNAVAFSIQTHFNMKQGLVPSLSARRPSGRALTHGHISAGQADVACVVNGQREQCHCPSQRPPAVKEGAW